ncbi:hypothetical protein HYC85_011136 [Camellia sinensis]|uniref:Chitinase domain-containing protein 1 n=1 Tax=Camellia sinensis TaxID=4442 RepID=A0A7J7HJY0_CAMSI|nr:hypothetical protein HYC85_011136 [Camellia sinensis]
MPLSRAFQILAKKGHLKPFEPWPLPKNLPLTHDATLYCAYHQQSGHSTDGCFCLRHEVQDLIDNEVILSPTSAKSVTTELLDFEDTASSFVLKFSTTHFQSDCVHILVLTIFVFFVSESSVVIITNEDCLQNAAALSRQGATFRCHESLFKPGATFRCRAALFKQGAIFHCLRSKLTCVHCITPAYGLRLSMLSLVWYVPVLFALKHRSETFVYALIPRCMGKRREKRVATATGSNHRRDRHRTTDSAADSNPNRDRKLFIIFVVFFIVLPAISLIVYTTLFASRTDTSLPNSHQPGLAKIDMNYLQVLTENSKLSENTSHRHFRNPVLAYITPWNSRGYDIAKTCNSKFTHLSPVWYDLKSQGTKLVLEGRHNADKGWLSELRMKGNALVLPRVVLEAFPNELLKKKQQRKKAIDLIVRECEEMEYDGIVLESWSRWAAYRVLHDPDMRNTAVLVLNDLQLSGLGGGAITGRDYLSLLEQHKPSFQWEKNSAEHFFIYSDNQHVKHAVFYPSLMSISMRLEEARSWGAGISIWEIGQGLDYFFDLL